MKKLFYFLLCFLLCSCSEGCNDEYYDVIIYNSSSEAIYYLFIFGMPPSKEVLKSSSWPYKSEYQKIESCNLEKIRMYEPSLHYGMQVLIIKSSTMDKYDNKAFYEADDICDKRFILSYDDLQKMDLIIEYTDDQQDHGSSMLQTK